MRFFSSKIFKVISNNKFFLYIFNFELFGFLSFRKFDSLTVEIQVEKSLISTAATFIDNIIPMKAKPPIKFCLYNMS